jgi:membrane associated rhomboid family serine protease
MASSPDLFVVCKNCGAEVSPYITECPYCGTRLRKRAPKLEKGGIPKPPKPKRSRPMLGRLKPGEIPGIRADSRPWAAWVLVVASVLVPLGGRAGFYPLSDLALPAGDEYWRGLTTLFVYGQTGYEVVAVGAMALFAWLLERRHGWWAPLLIFLLCGAAGSALVIAVDPGALAVGANGVALGMLCAWVVRDLLARRRGEEDDADMLGVLAIAVVLVLLPIVSPEAHALAGLGGGVMGLLLGLVLARLRER